MTASKVLELAKICKDFQVDPVVTALVDIDLVVERGDWLTITGPSGSGKSTLLNIIGCLDQPTSGRFQFDGIDTTTLKEAERAGLRSQRIGFVFQSFHLLPYRTVLENVMLSEIYRGQGFPEVDAGTLVASHDDWREAAGLPVRSWHPVGI